MRFALICTLLLIALPASAGKLVNRVVVVVNNNAIIQSELDQMMATMVPQLQKAGGAHAVAFMSARRQAVEQLIDDTLMREQMHKADIAVSDQDVDAALKNFLLERNITKEQLQGALAQQGIAMHQFLKRISDELLQMKFIQQEVGQKISLSDEELRQYYQRNRGKFDQSGKVRVSEIVLTLPEESNDKAQRQLLKKALKVARQAKQGHFAQMAKKHSNGAEASTGGDLGVVDPTTLHPKVRTALLRLKVGQVSQPILSDKGYHILTVTDRGSTGDEDFARLKPQIHQALYQEKMAGAIQQYLAELRAKAYIEVME